MDNNETKKRKPLTQKKKMERLIVELTALCSCHTDDICTFFDRASSLSLSMLKKEKTLDYFFDEARKINEDIKIQKAKVLLQLEKLRKKLNLDQVIPFFKDCGSILHRSLALFDDTCIQQIFNLLLSTYARIEDLPPDENELFTALCHWRWLHTRVYPIGEHPVFAIALLEYTISQYAVLQQTDDPSFSPIFCSEYAKKLRKDAEISIRNLILELPQIRSWSAFSWYRHKKEEIACRYAIEEWARDDSLSIREVARRVVMRLAKEKIIISESVCYKYIEKEAPPCRRKQKK